MNKLVNYDVELNRSSSNHENLIIVNKPTLIMVDHGHINISSYNDYISINEKQMAVLVKNGKYYIHNDNNSIINTQIISTDDPVYTDNFVVNIEDSRKACNLIQKDIPLLFLSDRLISIGNIATDVLNKKENDILFVYNDVSVYSSPLNHSINNDNDIYDAIVIGAGPYGTSAALSLKNNNFNIYWAGEPLSFWLRNIQPTLLRSAKSATNLYIDNQEFTFLDFLNKFKLSKDGKIKYSEFLAYYFYLLTYLNDLPEHEKVVNVHHKNGLWHIKLQGVFGLKTIISKNVINATGIGIHPNIPETVSNLPFKIAAHVSHTAVHDLPVNKKIAVIGGAQSAVEYALEADNNGNEVTMYIKDKLKYRNLHEPTQFMYRYLASNCEKIIPYLPVPLKTKLLSFLLEGTCEPQIKDHLEASKIRIFEDTVIIRTEISDEKPVVISNRGESKFDLIVSATGYNYDIHHLNYTSGFITSKNQMVAGRFPNLNVNAMLKNTPPGMYFAGFACMYSIGFKAQFINGTNIVIKRIINDIIRRS